MSRWGGIDNWRDYLTERALGEADEWRRSCTEGAMARLEARREAGEVSDDHAETRKWWVERMTTLARARFGPKAECVGTVTGATADYSIYNGDHRELGPYIWAEMDEAMEQWSEHQQAAALADGEKGSQHDAHQ